MDIFKELMRLGLASIRRANMAPPAPVSEHGAWLRQRQLQAGGAGQAGDADSTLGEQGLLRQEARGQGAAASVWIREAQETGGRDPGHPSSLPAGAEVQSQVRQPDE
eukprot:6812686-Pyramimonas_sp.AAC.1